MWKLKSPSITIFPADVVCMSMYCWNCDKNMDVGWLCCPPGGGRYTTHTRTVSLFVVRRISISSNDVYCGIFCLVQESEFLWTTATPPPRPVVLGTCNSEYPGGVSSSHTSASAESVESQVSVTHITSSFSSCTYSLNSMALFLTDLELRYPIKSLLFGTDWMSGTEVKFWRLTPLAWCTLGLTHDVTTGMLLTL